MQVDLRPETFRSLGSRARRGRMLECGLLVRSSLLLEGSVLVEFVLVWVFVWRPDLELV